MPYPGSQNHIYEIAMGITPVTASMSALLVAGLASVALKRHWHQIEKEGHFDRPCNKCLDLIGTPKTERKRMREHIAEWSKEDRELTRRYLVRAIKQGQPFHISWERINGASAGMRTLADEDGRVYGLVLRQPRATA